MAQTILTVVAEVQPASADIARKLLNDLVLEQEAKPNPDDQSYDRLRSDVPTLHFMSMTVTEDDQYDPVFVLEANFDGEPSPFWAQLEAAIGSVLRDVLRLCKPPRDERIDLFNSATAAGSNAPLGPLLEALTVWPAVSHQGNRGLDRARIIAEGKLFRALREVIDATPELHSKTAGEIHHELRERLKPAFPWLEKSEITRIGLMENIADCLRLTGFFLIILFALFGMGWMLMATVHSLGFTNPCWLSDYCEAISITLMLLGAMALRLLWLERRDATNDAPRLDPTKSREMAQHEDFVAQNHMISIVHVKSGALRMIMARLILVGIGLYLRVFARSGYLASMRTIHFAHWAFLDNGGRLMFHSNFDGSWESYLDDFIEKAHVGLTLAWTHGVGFPATRFLYQGGATEGRKFKAWARHSMSPSQFWFSAYKEYSVNQIERQARLANGLRRLSLNDKEASAWALDL